jgi:hypothetical protein
MRQTGGIRPNRPASLRDGTSNLKDGSASRPCQFQFTSKALFPAGFRPLPPVFSAPMFETVKTEIAAAAGKLTHLRRFL